MSLYIIIQGFVQIGLYQDVGSGKFLRNHSCKIGGYFARSCRKYGILVSGVDLGKVKSRNRTNNGRVIFMVAENEKDLDAPG